MTRRRSTSSTSTAWPPRASPADAVEAATARAPRSPAARWPPSSTAPLAADGRRYVAGLGLAILLAGCPTAPSPTVVPSIPPLDIGESGRPFEAADLLEAMRSSPRPGGVPDQLETEAIA